MMSRYFIILLELSFEWVRKLYLLFKNVFLSFFQFVCILTVPSLSLPRSTLVQLTRRISSTPARFAAFFVQLISPPNSLSLTPTKFWPAGKLSNSFLVTFLLAFTHENQSFLNTNGRWFCNQHLRVFVLRTIISMSQKTIFHGPPEASVLV